MGSGELSKGRSEEGDGGPQRCEVPLWDEGLPIVLTQFYLVMEAPLINLYLARPLWAAPSKLYSMATLVKAGPQTSSSSIWALVRRQNLSPIPDPPSQNLPFNKLPGACICSLKFEKHGSMGHWYPAVLARLQEEKQNMVSMAICIYNSCHQKGNLSNFV